MIPTKLTKSALSKILNWSSSRYNVYTKPEAIQEIIEGMKEGGIWVKHRKDGYNLDWPIVRDIEPLGGKPRVEYLVTRREYSSGSYCECSSMTRAGTYQVDFEKKTLLSVEDNKLYQF